MTTVSDSWTVRRLLEWTVPFFSRKAVDAPRLSAELLLAHVLGIPRIRLYTDYEKPVAPEPLARFRELVRRAAEHEPIAYLTGIAHFFGLEFEVTSQVLIPRPDTETLVENVLHLVRNQVGMEAPRVLDLCTGSGCIAGAIAQRLPRATVIATDIAQGAVDLARRNMQRLDLAGRVTVEQGDLYDALAHVVDAAPFHLILANPPYVTTAEMDQLDRNVRDYEPVRALHGGEDGLDIHRRIIAGAAGAAGAPAHLLPGGRIFLEIGYRQADAARELLAQHPAFDQVSILRDYAGRDRVITARRR
jgi:release factor glutamine methyltransferase